jgi:hypothetical protein
MEGFPFAMTAPLAGVPERPFTEERSRRPARRVLWLDCEKKTRHNPQILPI